MRTALHPTESHPNILRCPAMSRGVIWVYERGGHVVKATGVSGFNLKYRRWSKDDQKANLCSAVRIELDIGFIYKKPKYVTDCSELKHIDKF